MLEKGKYYFINFLQVQKGQLGQQKNELRDNQASYMNITK